MPTKTLAEQTVDLIREHGKAALEHAKVSMQKEKVAYKPLQEALYYFVDEFFKDISQPGLLSLYCEAIGGDPRETTKVGGAMVLLVSAADLHDDIIDNSKTKGGRLTVLGKFGKELAILAGDAFLVKGLFLLHEVTEDLPEQKRAAVLNLIKQAFFDLSSTEAEEAHCCKKNNLTGQQYLEILKRKTAVSEATARIGAILGNGTTQEIETLGDIGITMSLVNTIRDEFIDIFEAEELRTRTARGVLPLPLLFAFQDPKKEEAITRLLKDGRITKELTEEIVNIVMAAEETENLRNLMRSQIRDCVGQLVSLESGTEALKLVLESALEDLQ